MGMIEEIKDPLLASMVHGIHRPYESLMIEEIKDPLLASLNENTKCHVPTDLTLMFLQGVRGGAL